MLYKKIPLIEIIVEIRWAIQHLTSLHAFIDPHFDEFFKNFGNTVSKQGFNFFEKLVPDEIPREFIAGQPLFRFRKKSHGYPLFQIGHGLLTINTAPTAEESYTGWDAFLQNIQLATKALFESYPIASKYLTIDHLDLKYINAFDKDFGYNAFTSFAQAELGISIASKKATILATLREDAEFQLVYEGKLKSLDDNIGSIKLYPGTKKDPNKEDRPIPALFAELGMRTHSKTILASQEKIIAWLENAHATISDDWFQSLIQGNIKTLMGEQ